MNERRFEVVQELAQSLIDGQFPAWSHLPIKKIDSAGTDNSIYRLGSEFGVRFPVSVSAAEQIAKEHRWLSKFAGMSMPIPKVIGAVQPTEDFSFSWSVMNWFEGNDATNGVIANWRETAEDLGQFVKEFRNQNTYDAPLAGKHNAFRGTDLVNLDRVVRNAIDALRDMFDHAVLLDVWEESLNIPPWAGTPQWIHGDLHAANIILQNGKVAGIIDFGLMGVGDPACDLALGWSFLPSHARDVFRAAAGVDEQTWHRGKGWGLYIGVVALSYYRDHNPILSGIAEKAIRAVIEHSEGE